MIEILASYQLAEGTPWYFIFFVLLIFMFTLSLPVLIRLVVLRRPVINLWAAIILALFFGIIISVFAFVVANTFEIVILQNMQLYLSIAFLFYSYWIMHIGYRSYCIKKMIETAEEPKNDSIDCQQEGKSKINTEKSENELNKFEQNKRSNEPTTTYDNQTIPNTEKISPISQYIENDFNKRAHQKYQPDSNERNIEKPNVIAKAPNTKEEAFISSQETLNPNSDTKPNMLGRIEKCANCERIIGKLENSYNFNGNIVCTKCFQILNPKYN